MKEQLSQEKSFQGGKCDGKTKATLHPTHIAKYLVVRQERPHPNQRKRIKREVKWKKDSELPTSELLFTELKGFEMLGFSATPKFVIFGDGGHFKAAVATPDDKWIVHDGLLVVHWEMLVTRGLVNGFSLSSRRLLMYSMK